MTGPAGQGRVAAGQGKARPAVIKSRDLPSAGRVAVGAGRAETAEMRVLVAVASDAGRLRTAIAAIGVAAVTGDPRVGAAKRKPCAAVVKSRGLPGDRPMAAGAGWTQGALVGVIPGMTGGAGGRGA